MGQWDVYGFLKKNKGEWFTAKQISEHLGVSSSSVVTGAKKLRKTGLVESKTVKWTSKRMPGFKEIFAYRFKDA